MRGENREHIIMLEAITQSILTLDKKMRILSISGAMDAEIKNKLISKSIDILCVENHSLLDISTLATLQEKGFLYNKLLHCSGATYEVSIYTICQTLSNKSHYTLFVRKRVTASSNHLGVINTRDIHTLTQLPNQHYLLSFLEERTSQDEKDFAILFIEFDDLKIFNESAGVAFNNQLVLQIAQRISTVLSKESILTHVSNQQFVVVVDDMYIVDHIKDLATKILHLFNEPFIVNTTMFYVSVSIGVSLYPLDTVEPYHLLKMAEDTMYNVQKEGKNHFALTQHLDRSLSQRRSTLLSDLPIALENGDIYFLYQCQYDYDKESFSGAEMLARWEHPLFGDIPPSIFIPLAEQSGMIGPLTVNGIIEASKLLDDLSKIGASTFSISVNISPLVLMKSDFLETIEFLMESYDLKGKPLNFEVTEEMFTGNLGLITQVLEKLRSMGISIEIDDFGTGFTSLIHLVYLPIDTLKVDRSFVMDIHTNKKRKILFKAIVEMSRALDIKVIAEGVERDEEDKVLRNFGSMKIQGFFYSKPISHHKLLSKVSAWK